MSMPTLKVTRGASTGQLFELTQDELLVGSGIRNDIVLKDLDVSPRHCRLVRVDGIYRLYDLGSKRGTFVSGKLVLNDGIALTQPVVIELGESVAMDYQPDDNERVSTDKLKQHSPFYLVIRRRADIIPRVYPLEGDQVTIGRELSNDIILPEPKVSRYHIRLERVPRGFILHDLKTSNGTFINRHRINLPTLLQPGDYIAIADAVEMWFTDDLDAFKV
jgi:pSer/pThr/pTyr-binding forkhead associated (FHA) protein